MTYEEKVCKTVIGMLDGVLRLKEGQDLNIFQMLRRVKFVPIKRSFAQIWESELENAPDRLDYCAEYWSLEDVMQELKDRGVKLTKEQGRVLLGEVETETDANIGINWDAFEWRS